MLIGPRVTLRAFRKVDLPALVTFSNDVEVELLSGGDTPRPHTLEGWEKWYEAEIAKDKHDAASFIMEADGKLIGTCGIWAFDETSHTCALGIGIGDREYWGRGYGREAIGLLLDYAFRIRNFQKVSLDTCSNNERAIRCYLACGFVEEGRQRRQLWSGGQYVDKVYMGILREEWADLKT